MKSEIKPFKNEAKDGAVQFNASIKAPPPTGFNPPQPKNDASEVKSAIGFKTTFQAPNG